MFDVNNVSRKIKDARVKKNLTQNALADAMCVSYQAVSNWERGNAMPDISKLGELCRILDLDLYELLGDTRDAETAEKIIKEEKDCTIGDIASIAAVLEPEMLMELIDAADEKTITMADLINLAPFVDSETMEELGKDVVPKSMGEIVAISPFVSDKTCAGFIDRIEDFSGFDIDLGTLCALGPFLPEEKLDKLAEKVVPETYSSLCSVAPFVSQKALDKMAEKVRNPDIDNVLSAAVCLRPFLSGGALKKIFKKAK